MVDISYDDYDEHRHVRMNRSNDECEEREDELYVRCPFCEGWRNSRDLLVEGCHCGASATTLLRFTTDDAEGDR